MNSKIKYFVHKKAIVESKNIGEKTKIWAFCNILKGATIGKNCNIGDACYVEGKATIGDNVTIKNGVSIWNSIVVEDNVFIGPAVVFTNDKFPRSRNKDWIEKKTVLKKGCSIGANATILPGLTIGEYSMVGAGSVVTKDVSDYSVVYGNPAKAVGKVSKEGKLLKQ